MKYIILLLCIGLFYGSCKQDVKEVTKTATQKLFDEVMVIHDEVMPMMSEVHRQKRKLLDLLDHVDGINIIKEDIDPSILYLQESDERMMQWMADLQSNRQDENTEASLDYFNKQKKKITTISRLIKTSINSAKKITDNVKIPTK